MIYRSGGDEMEIQLETAKAEHLEQYEEILHAGRRFQQEQGFIQWTENYPNRDTILEDIRFQKIGRAHV